MNFEIALVFESIPRIVDRIETADFRVVRRFLPDGEPLMSQQITGEPPRVVRRFAPSSRSVEATREYYRGVWDGLIAVWLSNWPKRMAPGATGESPEN